MITLEHISKNYGNTLTVKDVSLEIKAGEVIFCPLLSIQILQGILLKRGGD
ncbi:hypothetical protein PIPA1_18100 [Pelosinus sp. IPA-1]|nr:hypothetical protein PIPA1_18100 [Pelosinus sp. IPA-1]